MSSASDQIQELANQAYKYGFVTEIEAETVPKGLNEDIIRMISAKKSEPKFMLDWRLRAYRHWLTMEEPKWANVHYPPINYQESYYYSAPKLKTKPKSLDEVDPQLLETYEKLGIPLRERELLAGVAVDAVFDSISVATTFREKLAQLGIIFCSFSDAVQNHPDLVQQYLGSVVPYTDNFFATLNSAVFSDGSFCYIMQNRITSGHARAILSLENKEKQKELSALIIKRGLSVREAEAIAKRWSEKPKKSVAPAKKKGDLESQLSSLQDSMRKYLGTKVHISQKGERGKIEIEYYSHEDLERIVEAILKNA